MELKPENLKTKGIFSKKVVKFNSPWPLYQIDNFLPNDILKSVQSELASLKLNNQISVLEDHPFRTEYALCCVPELYQYMNDVWFLKEFALEFDCEFEMCSEQAIQHRVMRPESNSIFPHHDFGTSYTFGMILYTSQEWRLEQGGEFVAMDGYDFSSLDRALQPIPNRAIFFFNGIDSIHRVNPLKFGERDSLVIEWNVSLLKK